MAVALELTDRYSNTPLELEAFKILKRVEVECLAEKERQATKQRARAWLDENTHQPAE